MRYNTIRVAALMITIDRKELTLSTLRHNLENAGHPLDLFITDNGSTDGVFEAVEEAFAPTYSKKNGYNQGVAGAFNDMLLEANSMGYNFFVLLGNDIKNDTGWLLNMVTAYKNIPNSGLIALNWGCGANPMHQTTINEIPVDLCVGVFGVMGFGKEVLDKVGYFCTDYWPYGLEDSDFNHRVTHSGFRSYYLRKCRSKHLGEDVGKQTEYRRVKDKSLERNLPKFQQNIAEYDRSKNYYVEFDNDPYKMN
mgnify:CR=1 FL=1